MLQSGVSAPVKIDDGSLALYHKLKDDAWFQDNFVGYSTNWFNVNAVVQSKCVASRSVLTLVDNPTNVTVADNCFIAERIYSRSK